jgi:hypothetical protein
MLKIHILTTCSQCNGEAYQPIGEAEDCQGNKYIRHIPCPTCEGSGNEPKWVDIQYFTKLMHQAACPHQQPLRKKFEFLSSYISGLSRPHHS